MKDLILLSLLNIFLVVSQENAGTNVAPAIIECYNKTENLVRENRPETTIVQLIELITKIESSSSIQNDRELSKEILHRFKQDGISKQKNVIESKYTIPYSPMDYQSDKNRLLLKVLVPGNAVLFPNETLSELERCSLHFMISTSINTAKRDDEATTCKRFAQYVRRIRRDVESNLKGDFEVFEPVWASPLKGSIRESAAADIPETEVLLSKNTEESSECPIENGVIYTKWGAIAPGTVIAGMAAGRMPQEIPSRGKSINTIYAATLVGDLGEVALQQGSRGKNPVAVGASGGWNNIETPRTFYLEKNDKDTNYEMTDAELRGGLDGLILGLNIKEWHSKVPTLKISQVLDMYYSPRGVFSKKYRACNRKQLFTEVAPLATLTEQTIAYSYLLKGKTKLPGTIFDEGIEAYSIQAAQVLLDYTATKLSDISCAVDDGTIERISTDIIIAVDSGWDYTVAKETLTYLISSIDINKYDSKYTIISGNDGTIIVESTHFVGELHTNFTKDRHYIASKTPDVDKVLESAADIIKGKMDKDKETNKAGGPSHILLFFKYDTLSESDKIKVEIRKANIQMQLPDLRLLVLGRGSKDAYESLVFNPTYDLFELSEKHISESVKPLIERIRQIPRRIVNPKCGSNWSGESSTSDSFDQFVEPFGINFYRLTANYLFGEETKSVKIKGYGYGSLVACSSRVNSRPVNVTQDNVNCETISGNNEVEFKLEDPCRGYSTPLECAPVFFSVQAQSRNESSVFRCTESSCRFPDNIKYSIVVDKLGCYSGANFYTNNMVVITCIFLILRFIL